MQNGEKIKETTSGVSQYMDANLLSVCIFESVYCVEDEGGKEKKKKGSQGNQALLKRCTLARSRAQSPPRASNHPWHVNPPTRLALLGQGWPDPL